MHPCPNWPLCNFSKKIILFQSYATFFFKFCNLQIEWVRSLPYTHVVQIPGHFNKIKLMHQYPKQLLCEFIILFHLILEL
jgi:hypothetical protein